MKRALLALALLAAPLHADQILVGPPASGAPFDSIAAAVAAAAPGDTVCVLPGSYAGFTLDKALTVLGAGSSLVTTGPIVVTGIPAGSAAMVSGLEVVSLFFEFPPIFPPLEITDNDGSVVAHDLVLRTMATVALIDAPPNPALVIRDTDRALVLACTAMGSQALAGGSGSGAEIENSRVWISDSTLAAGNSFLADPTPGVPGLDATGSQLSLSRTDVTGAFGAMNTGTSGPGGAGVRAAGCTLALAGGGSTIQGGQGNPTSSQPGGPALELVAGTQAYAAADVVLAGGFDGLGTVQTAPTSVDRSSLLRVLGFVLPTVAVSPPQASPGGAFAIDARGTPAGLYYLVVSSALGAPLALPASTGTVQLDLSLATRVLLPFDATGASTVNGVLPADPLLAGATLWVQIGEHVRGTLAVSDPALLAVVP